MAYYGRWFNSIFIFMLILSVEILSFTFNNYLPPFNNSTKIYSLCTDTNDRIILEVRNHSRIDFYLEKYGLCWKDFLKFVRPSDHSLVWLMMSLRFCDVNQLYTQRKHKSEYDREFQKRFLKYSYTLICDRGSKIGEIEHYNYFVYSSLFNTLYERNNSDRQIVCDRISSVYADLYGRCYVPHVSKRQAKIKERCHGHTAPLMKFQDFYLRFSKRTSGCDSFEEFINKSDRVSSLGRALSNDTVFMNLLSSNLVSNIHSDSELPSLVLKTRLLLQHFSLAAIKLWHQLEKFKECRLRVAENLQDLNASNETGGSDLDFDSYLTAQVSHECCAENPHLCELHNEKRFRQLAEWGRLGYYVEGCLLLGIICNTILLAFLLQKTRRNLSTATVLFVFNIMFSNVLFLLSFTFFFEDFIQTDKPYGNINEDHQDKTPELVIAESLQTHLFHSTRFGKHLVQEMLFSLAQNGSLTGLIHLLVLVLVVINRSMSGKSIHLSRISVISVFACVWFFLLASHAVFSAMQMSAIQNLDQLFAVLAKGRGSTKCSGQIRSGYVDIAKHCDTAAVFHAFGAYLLRGHTLFTMLFLSASIIILVITISYHVRIRRQHEIVHKELSQQSPHQRRERLFHTLIFSIATFFLSVMGQTYIEIAVFWVDERADIAALSKWYHLTRILAFIDPVLNPLIVVARTPALRRQLRSQWTTLRSRTSSKTALRSRENSNPDNRRSNNGSRQSSIRRSARKKHQDVELNLIGDRSDRPITRSTYARRSADSQTHNSVV